MGADCLIERAEIAAMAIGSAGCHAPKFGGLKNIAGDETLGENLVAEVVDLGIGHPVAFEITKQRHQIVAIALFARQRLGPFEQRQIIDRDVCDIANSCSVPAVSNGAGSAKARLFSGSAVRWHCDTAEITKQLLAANRRLAPFDIVGRLFSSAAPSAA